MAESYKKIKKYFGSESIVKILSLISKTEQFSLDTKSNCYELIKRDVDNLNNPYVLLAYKFVLYNNGIEDDTADYMFYNKLKEMDDNLEYSFPISENDVRKVRVDIFNPFIDFRNGIIDPKWHLLISCFAYIDVVYNCDSEKEIQCKVGWSDHKRICFRSKSIQEWIKELEDYSINGISDSGQ